MENLSLSVKKKKKKKIESLKKKNKTKHNSHSSQNGIPQGPQWELVEDISTLPKARENVSDPVRLEEGWICLVEMKYRVSQDSLKIMTRFETLQS